MDKHLLSGRYKVSNSLAAGGMGKTFIAEDTHLPGNPICVVKQLKPATPDSSFMATAKRLFFSEAETLQKLGAHDQIPRLLAYFEEDQEFYLVQEYIEGNPLSQEILLGQRWSEPEVIQLLEEILEVLSFVHDQSVIHRDIKPDNIIRRDRDRKLVLIDFGAVKQIQSAQTNMASQASGTIAIGTHGYMPIEQVSGKPRMSSDLYAVGKIAIQALTGLLPTQFREDEDGNIIWRDQAEVSDGLGTFLDKMVHDYHKLRYQSSQEALQALQQLNQTAPPAYTPTEIGDVATQLPPDAQQPVSSPPPISANPIPANPVPASPASPPPSPTATPTQIDPAVIRPTGEKTSKFSSEAPHPSKTAATVVVSPGQPSNAKGDRSASNTQGKTARQNSDRTKESRDKGSSKLPLIAIGSLAVLGFVGGMIGYTAVTNRSANNNGNRGPTEITIGGSPSDPAPPSETPPSDQNDPPEIRDPDPVDTDPVKPPPEETDPKEPDPDDNPFQPDDFPKRVCGDTNINTSRTFYRVYILRANLESTVKDRYCGDAFLESSTNRVKVASFSSEEQAIHFKNFMEDNVGPVAIETVN
ncbi:MAG: protein kinase [Cyanobacteria bacterium J06632_3]